MRILVAGSRGFQDYKLLRKKLDKITRNCKEVIILSGTAKGADRLGEQWAKEKGHTVERYPADWKKHGQVAGYLRNLEMLKKCDAVVVFWNGWSKGTRHVIIHARFMKKPLRIVRFYEYREESQDYNKWTP